MHYKHINMIDETEFLEKLCLGYVLAEMRD